LKLAEKYKSNNEIAISEFRMGGVYQRYGQQEAAEKHYLQAIQHGKITDNISLIKSLADTLSIFYSNRNNFSSAFNYMNLSKIMADSLIAIDKQANMKELVIKFEFDKIIKDYKISQAMADEKIKQQKIAANYLLIISILLVIFGIVILVRYKRKKKDNKLLLVQKNQIEKKNREIQLQLDEIESILKKQISYNRETFSDLSEYSDMDKIFLNKCMDVIKAHIDDTEFTVDILSERTATSRRNLYRRLKDLTGLKPAELIRFVRMQHAANLLRSTGMRIQEIAMATGYENVNNFRQAFKSYHGVVPSKFIESELN
jgi:AraC-like DNA-binding protein